MSAADTLYLFCYEVCPPGVGGERIIILHKTGAQQAAQQSNKSEEKILLRLLTFCDDHFCDKKQLVSLLSLPPLNASKTLELIFIFRIFWWMSQGYARNILDLISGTMNLCLKYSTV